MFDRDVVFYGDNAKYLKSLCVLAPNVPDKDKYNNFKIFNTYVDAYVSCPLLGYVYSRKGTISNESKNDSARIFAEAIIKRENELRFIYKTIMLIDEEYEPNVEKRIYNAFRAETNESDIELMNQNIKIFNKYFVGGLEFLYEKFVENYVDEDTCIDKIHKFVEDFYSDQNVEKVQKQIQELLNS